MPNEPFMLVSLNEEKAKRVAQVLSNPTATRILQALTGKEATESELAKSLDIPLSTVHYNLQQLVEAKLVLAEEFHYSPKGREVNHYKLANKYIIIAPSEDTGFLERLKKLIPLVTITAVGAIALKVAQWVATPAAQPEMAMRAFDAAPAMALKATAPIVESTPWWQGQMVDWLILGAASVIVLLILVEAYRYRKEKPKQR